MQSKSILEINQPYVYLLQVWWKDLQTNINAGRVENINDLTAALHGAALYELDAAKKDELLFLYEIVHAQLDGLFEERRHAQSL